jgi:hypothetical protein
MLVESFEVHASHESLNDEAYGDLDQRDVPSLSLV